MHVRMCFFSLGEYIRCAVHILNTPVSGKISHLLKGQILVTTTTILIELGAIERHKALLETFISVVFSYVCAVNSPEDRYVRQMV